MSNIISLILLSLLLINAPLGATEYVIPSDYSDSVVGKMHYVRVKRGQHLYEIAKNYDIGRNLVINSNPGLDPNNPPEGSIAVIPALHILPDAPRTGIVLNLIELRLYYYPPGQNVVHTYPVSIGKVGWETPLGVTKIASKAYKPSWNPPESIKQEFIKAGDPPPSVVPGGDPRNPLGNHALRLGFDHGAFLLHGVAPTMRYTIGSRVSHGCIRLYPEDVEQLYNSVPQGTEVRVIDQSMKVGKSGKHIYLQVSEPIQEVTHYRRPTMSEAMNELRYKSGPGAHINEYAVELVIRKADGIPHIVGYTK